MTGAAPSGQIDHINKIKDDNRWSNLRDVSGSVNQQNRNRAMVTNSTQLLGAFKHGAKFCAKIHIDNKQVYLGSFATAEDAHLAYMTAKALCHEGYVPC
jgi:type II secretory pathway component PulK